MNLPPRCYRGTSRRRLCPPSSPQFSRPWADPPRLEWSGPGGWVSLKIGDRRVRRGLTRLPQRVFNCVGMMCDDSQENAGRTIRPRSALAPVSDGRGLEPEARGKLGLAEAELLAW